MIYRWATKYCGCDTKDRMNGSEKFTLFELRTYLNLVITKTMKACDAAEEYGISKTTGNRYMKEVLYTLKVPSLKKVQNLFKLKFLSRE